MDSLVAFEIVMRAYARLYPPVQMDMMRRRATDADPRAQGPLPLDRRTVRRPAGHIPERTL